MTPSPRSSRSTCAAAAPTTRSSRAGPVGSEADAEDRVDGARHHARRPGSSHAPPSVFSAQASTAASARGVSRSSATRGADLRDGVGRRRPRGSPTAPRASGRAGPARRRAGRGCTPSRCGSAGRGGRAGSPSGRRRRRAACETRTRLPLDLLIFAPSKPDHRLVDVVPGEDVVAGERRRLDGAHLVVREDEVAAPALDVDLGAEPVEGDRRALDVPAGPPGAEDVVVPRRLARAGGAPEQRVERVALALAVGVTAALDEDGGHLLAGPPGDRAEVGRRREVEVDVLAAHRREPGAGRPQPRSRRPRTAAAICAIDSTTPT